MTDNGPATEHDTPADDGYADVPAAARNNRFIPLAAVAVVLAVNGLASGLPLNGYTTGELSRLNPTGFTPAGYAFSIWGLIYLGLIGYALTAAFAKGAAQDRALAIAPLFLANAAANVSWLVVWHYRFVGLSVVAMAGLLITLAVMFFRLRRLGPPDRPITWWTVDGPITLYFGWISCASIVNIGAWLATMDSYPFALTQEAWALFSVAGATALFVLMVVGTRSLTYGLVFVWAASAIALRPEGVSQPVQAAAVTGVVAVAGLLGWTLTQRRS